MVRMPLPNEQGPDRSQVREARDFSRIRRFVVFDLVAPVAVSLKSTRAFSASNPFTTTSELGYPIHCRTGAAASSSGWVTTSTRAGPSCSSA